MEPGFELKAPGWEARILPLCKASPLNNTKLATPSHCYEMILDLREHKAHNLENLGIVYIT